MNTQRIRQKLIGFIRRATGRIAKQIVRFRLPLLSAVAVLGIFAIAGMWLRGTLPAATATVALILLATVPGAHWLLRTAGISAAFHLVALGLFVGQTILIFTNGISAAGLIVLLFPAVATGLLINRYASSLYAVAGLVIFVLAHYSGKAGRLDSMELLEALLALLCIVLLMLLINRGVVASLHRERRLIQELEKQRDSLEEQIRIRLVS